MRDAKHIASALAIIYRETRKAYLRNSHKKDPAREQPGYWFDKLREEADEAHAAWLNEGRERFFEEVGDVGNCLIGLILQAAFHLGEAPNYHLGEE